MCGRFASFLPAEALRQIFGTVNPAPNLAPSWNLAPTQLAPVVRLHPETKQRHLNVLIWGLIPYFTRDLKSARKPINARAESVATSPMFKAAFARRRCLVPAGAFYEWQKTASGKQPFAIARSDGQIMALGGLWEGWRSPEGEILRTFVIITVPANPDVAELHDRMPLIIEERDWSAWLGEAESDPTALLKSSPAGTLRVWSVSRAVNSPQNNEPQLLDPAES
jgi:putative SOS response-associated peptidase YedK